MTDRDPLLAPFAALIGTWSTEARHRLVDEVVTGGATFEWLEGGRFVLLRSHNDHELFPDAITVIGPPESGEGLVAEYFDSRGVRRTYSASLEDGVLRWWRDQPGFDQRAYARLAPDSFEFVAQLAETPGEWQDDLRTVYRRRARAPFTRTNLKADLPDLGANFDGPPDLEFRAATRALGLERSALTYQRVPPGYRFPYGHTHRTQEEVYVVVRGSGRMKVDDAMVEVGEWDAVRVPPGAWRGYEAGPDGLELLVIGAPNLGENPRDDVEGQRDWWSDR